MAEWIEGICIMIQEFMGKEAEMTLPMTKKVVITKQPFLSEVFPNKLFKESCKSKIRDRLGLSF